MPQTGALIGIEGVDGVCFRNDVDHVMNALPGNSLALDIERLSIDLSIHCQGK